MRTSMVDQPDTTFGIPERHQIFTQQPDPLRLPVFDKIFREEEGNPIKPEQPTKRSALSNPHEPLIVFVRQHLLSSVESSGSPKHAYLCAFPMRALTRADNPRSRAVQSGSDVASGFRGTGGSLPASTKLTIISTRRRSRSFSTSSTTNPSAVQPGSSG